MEMLRDSAWIRRVEDLALLDPSGLPLYLSVDLDVLDEKYASVILRRAVENGVSPEDIFVERNGEKHPYSELVKEVELPDGK